MTNDEMLAVMVRGRKRIRQAQRDDVELPLGCPLGDKMRELTTIAAQNFAAAAHLLGLDNSDETWAGIEATLTEAGIKV